MHTRIPLSAHLIKKTGLMNFKISQKNVPNDYNIKFIKAVRFPI